MADLLRALLERIDHRDAKVAVIGQGYVGLPVAVRAAELGFRVVGYDTSPERVAPLRDANSYVEDIPDEQLQSALDAGYWPTRDPLDLRAFDVAVITVPTPLREGVPDLTFIEAAGRDLVPRLTRGSLIVLESTTYPGTTEELLRPILEESGLRAGDDFFLAFSPEREDPGNPAFSCRTIPKVVGGVTETSRDLAADLYAAVVKEVVPVTSA